MITVECIPYKSFKEKIQITKELTRTVRPKIIEVYPTFIYIQKGDFEYDN